MKTLYPTLLCALIASGCASTRQAQAGAAAASPTEETLVCRHERLTGSNIRKRVCRYQAARGAERDAAQSLLRQRSQNAKGGEGP